MAKDTEQNSQQNSTNIAPEDLDLLNDSLEDEGKDDDALWKEFDAEESGSADPDDDPDHSSDEEAGQGANGDAADDDTTVTDPDSSASSEERNDRASKSTDDKQPSVDDRQGQDDEKVWADATPEQRAAYDAAQQKLRKLEQAERSNRGRLSALQRQINEMNRSGPSGAASQQGAAGGQQGQQGRESEEDADGFLASDDWKGFQEEYPEVAGPLGSVIGKLQEQVTRQNKELSAIGDDRRQSALDEQETLLNEEHPDWGDVITAENGFADWIFSQPRHIQEAAQRNSDEIVDASEAADVVGRFKQFLAEQQRGGDVRQNSASSGGGRDGEQPNSQSRRRERQLQSASSARSRGPGAASGIPEDGDEEVIWKAFDREEARRQRA